MQAFPRILPYIPWTIFSLLLGMIYVRLLLGENPVPDEGLWAPLRMLLNIGMLRLGLILGAVLALVFILADVCYLKSKLGQGGKAIALRGLCLLGLGVCVAIVHYVLEKVLDVI